MSSGTFCKKAIEILAPTLLNKWLPPLPRAVANASITRALSPAEPSKGPPLPSGLDISWPGYFTRAISRLKAEPPWVTIPKRGLWEELKREIQVVTGIRLGGKHG